MKMPVYLDNRMREPLKTHEIEVPFVPRTGDWLIIEEEEYEVKSVVIHTDNGNVFINVK